jgi:hypothetical protein
MLWRWSVMLAHGASPEARDGEPREIDLQDLDALAAESDAPAVGGASVETTTDTTTKTDSQPEHPDFIWVPYSNNRRAR